MPGELEMLSSAGFTLVRMDLTWDQIEHKPGNYEFQPWINLVANLTAFNMSAIFILDYHNPLYDGGMSPFTDQGRAAFARFAGAAANTFSPLGVILELYNEPDTGFWTPKPDEDAYLKMALLAGKEIKKQQPLAIVTGPALSGMHTCKASGLEWLEKCFRAGYLDVVDAVTVHAYGHSAPEERHLCFSELRALIKHHKANIPLWSGEWGYNTAGGGSHPIDEATQALYLARMLLFNLENDVPLSIWYDWRDDCTDNTNGECRFGIVHHIYNNADKPFEPKPAFYAAKTLMTNIGSRSLTDSHVSLLGEHVLRFEDVFAVWSDRGSFDISVTTEPNHCYKQIALDGSVVNDHLCADGQGHLVVKDCSKPEYLVV